MATDQIFCRPEEQSDANSNVSGDLRLVRHPQAIRSRPELGQVRAGVRDGLTSAVQVRTAALPRAR